MEPKMHSLPKIEQQAKTLVHEIRTAGLKAPASIIFGAGVFAHNNASPRYDDCVISGNYAVNWGAGALYCQGTSKPVLNNCTISSNSSSGTYLCDLDRCTVMGNPGGGVSDGIRNNCTISGNAA